MTFGNTKTGKTGTSTSEATETAQIKSIESLDKDNDMERGLKNRHVQFIAIGGTIGTGLFLGSGKSIALTGPSIIFVYIGVGLIMFLLMRAIGEMMYSDPSRCSLFHFGQLLYILSQRNILLQVLGTKTRDGTPVVGLVEGRLTIEPSCQHGLAQRAERYETDT